MPRAKTSYTAAREGCHEVARKVNEFPKHRSNGDESRKESALFFELLAPHPVAGGNPAWISCAAEGVIGAVPFDEQLRM